MKGINRKAIFYSVVAWGELLWKKKMETHPWQILHVNIIKQNCKSTVSQRDTTLSYSSIVAIPHLLRQATSFQADQQ